MKQFTLNLAKTYQRPIVKLSSWNNIRALLDTGAIFPIWTAPEELLILLGGTLIKKDVVFGGFGGNTTGNLYRLKMVTIGELVFPEMAIIACDDLQEVPYQIILSATMFQNLIYEIDDKNHRLSVTVPDGESTVRNLVVADSKGRLHVLCHSAEEETAESYTLSSDNKVNVEAANIAAAYRDYRSEPKNP